MEENQDYPNKVYEVEIANVKGDIDELKNTSKTHDGLLAELSKDQAETRIYIKQIFEKIEDLKVMTKASQIEKESRERQDQQDKEIKAIENASNNSRNDIKEAYGKSFELIRIVLPPLISGLVTLAGVLAALKLK